MRPGGEDHWAGLVDIPIVVVPLARGDSSIMGTPTMAHHFQAKGRGTVEVRFESQSFLLLAPATQQPMDRQSARPELDRYSRVVEQAQRKMQLGLQAGISHPARFEDATFAGARGL